VFRNRTPVLELRDDEPVSILEPAGEKNTKSGCRNSTGFCRTSSNIFPRRRPQRFSRTSNRALALHRLTPNRQGRKNLFVHLLLPLMPNRHLRPCPGRRALRRHGRASQQSRSQQHRAKTGGSPRKGGAGLPPPRKGSGRLLGTAASCSSTRPFRMRIRSQKHVVQKKTFTIAVTLKKEEIDDDTRPA